MQISEKIQFHQKISIFPDKLVKTFNLFRQFRKEKFDFPGKNWPFRATSGQIIPFLLESHHFRTYFLYMIRYNDISRPVHDPPRPSTTQPAQNLGIATPNLQD